MVRAAVFARRCPDFDRLATQIPNQMIPEDVKVGDAPIVIRMKTMGSESEDATITKLRAQLHRHYRRAKPGAPERAGLAAAIAAIKSDSRVNDRMIMVFAAVIHAARAREDHDGDPLSARAVELHGVVRSASQVLDRIDQPAWSAWPEGFSGPWPHVPRPDYDLRPARPDDDPDDIVWLLPH